MEHDHPGSPAAPEPALRGSLEDVPLPQILHRIFLEQLKGTLTLSRGGEARQLFFEKGELRTATSSREGQKIGSFRKRRGRSTEDDVTWALTEIARQTGSRFGRKLVERGLLPKSAIDSEMKRLVEEIVFSAFEWESGEFRFEPSTAVIDPDVALSLSTAAIIVEGIRRLPETPLFRERLGEGDRVLRLSRDPMSRYQYLPLTPQEAYILSRIDGLLDLDSLLAIAGSSRRAARSRRPDTGSWSTARGAGSTGFRTMTCSASVERPRRRRSAAPTSTRAGCSIRTCATARTWRDSRRSSRRFLIG